MRSLADRDIPEEILQLIDPALLKEMAARNPFAFIKLMELRLKAWAYVVDRAEGRPKQDDRPSEQPSEFTLKMTDERTGSDNE